MKDIFTINLEEQKLRELKSTVRSVAAEQDRLRSIMDDRRWKITAEHQDRDSYIIFRYSEYPDFLKDVMRFVEEGWMVHVSLDHVGNHYHLVKGHNDA
jgi:hypothetical protein